MAVRRRRDESSSKQKVLRIRPSEAATILDKCRHTLSDSSNLLENLRVAGLGPLLTRLDDKVLQLALQPDSWGERTRALLLSEIAPALGELADKRLAVQIEHFVEASKIVMPCVLLEIGRRKQHILVEFSSNPTGPGSCVTIRVGPTHPVHSLNVDQITRLMAVADAALVGLCYFGDPENRAEVESALTFQRRS